MSMIFQNRTRIYVLLIVSFFKLQALSSQGVIQGQLQLNESWDSIVYLSHIPTFEEMYSISNDGIIAQAQIDHLGYFHFDTEFLPLEEQLYRIHVKKKEDVPASLIIGGKDENHLFLLSSRHSTVKFETKLSSPPFKSVVFTEEGDNNILFQQITNLAYRADSIASMSSVAKRQFIENTLYEELQRIADTTNNPLNSLYALYRANFEQKHRHDRDFYVNYARKWQGEKSDYFEAFRAQLSYYNPNYSLYLRVLSILFLLLTGFFLGRMKVGKKHKIKKLSLQERKIFELLKQGASNQEISTAQNIEISTVKSHVSRIYTKLNVKSRKDIVDMG